MKYSIAASSARRTRVRFYVPRLTDEDAELLEEVFSCIPGVNKVTVYQATCGCAFEHTCPREDILRRLDAFRFENVVMMTEKINPYISRDEMKERKLDPKLKNKLRMRIMAETLFDIAAPMPIQMGYHVWHLITLKEL